jgi:hypothetical protein
MDTVTEEGLRPLYCNVCTYATGEFVPASEYSQHTLDGVMCSNCDGNTEPSHDHDDYDDDYDEDREDLRPRCDCGSFAFYADERTRRYTDTRDNDHDDSRLWFYSGHGDTLDDIAYHCAECGVQLNERHYNIEWS